MDRVQLIVPHCPLATHHITYHSRGNSVGRSSSSGGCGVDYVQVSDFLKLLLMADSYEKVGVLIPCNKGEEKSDDSVSMISVFRGANVVGRSNLSEIDKRVSRKHVCLVGKDDGSVEVVVEGPNPIVIQCGLDRKKFSSHEKAQLLHNNILELIPGCFAYKYISLVDEKNASLRNNEKLVVNTSSLKRKHQVLEDEAYARSVQEELWNGSISTTDKFDTPSKANADRSSCSLDSMRHFSVSSEIIPLTFRLLRVQGIPAWANTSSVSIDDVIEGNVLVAVLSNYMVDIDWLIGACPLLKRISHVLVIHGEKGASLEHMKKMKHSNWVLHQPPLPISYGTHHSKAMLVVYPHGVRVVVHTANLIHVDWNNKSQGVWMQDFPLKELNDETEDCAFENDLIGYLTALKLPDLRVNCPPFGNVNINASFFKKFDYRSAKVRLIASVPGYHSGSNLKRWGHMKLRDVLHSCCFDKVFQNSSLLYQFSSLGSLDAKWMDEFAFSMSSGMSDDRVPLGLGKAQIIWPTVEDVRCSLEGYAAGNAIPSPLKNVEKEFLKKYWARWQADHSGRGRAMPHIKSYTRYSGQNLAWFLLTSANLSKAAWGALQKNNSQLMIRSYELGVLFLPSQTANPTSGFSCSKDIGSSQKLAGTKVPMTKLVPLCWQGNGEESSEVVKLPIPYQIPPQPYSSEDIPWSWDRQYLKKDVFGQVWPRHVQLYIDENT